MEPEKKSNGGALWIFIIIILIVALVLIFNTKKVTTPEAEDTLATDPETAEVQSQATLEFSDSDDVSAIEADLDASIDELNQ